MDRSEMEHRLREAGLSEPRVTTLCNLLLNVRATGQIREVDLARMADSGFRDLDICVMRELLTAALGHHGKAGSPAIGSVLDAMEQI